MSLTGLVLLLGCVGGDPFFLLREEEKEVKKGLLLLPKEVRSKGGDSWKQWSDYGYGP